MLLISSYFRYVDFDFKMENDYFEDEDKCEIIDYENAMKVWRMKAKAVVLLCLLLKRRQKRQTY